MSLVFVARLPFSSSHRLTLTGLINATADGITRYVTKSVDVAVCADVFMQTDSKVILQHVTTNTHGVTRTVEMTEVEILIPHEWKTFWIINLRAKYEGLKPSHVFGDIWHLRSTRCIWRVTHEELQRYVVHEDVLQRDHAQLAKVCCQLQGVHLLHKMGTENLMKSQKRQTFWPTLWDV